ncbi:MAG TPA: glycosyltransferase family 39 protein [Sedimentisphaerales bacterium]|nr:glycosyltransferase family 39 protein [Sedimentisphaerales bacterium]
MSEQESPERNCRPAALMTVAALLASLAVLAFVFQGSRGLWQPDEGYYIGSAVTMLDKGSFLIPYLGEEVFLDKPPITYWAIMAGLKLFGHSEFGARAFNGLCYMATALTVGVLGWQMFRDRRIALLSSFLYATMVLPFLAANFVTPDTPLTLWTTLAVLFFWKSAEPNVRRPAFWKVLMCIALGLGFLAKGPAVLLACAGMFVFLAVRRQAGQYFWTPWALPALLVFCAVGLSWYFYVAARVPGADRYFFDNQVWGRLVSEKYKRNPGFTGALIYVPVLVFGSLPWSAIWLDKRQQIMGALFDRRWWSSLPSRPVALLLLSWFFVPLFILCLASSKLGLYVLPILPPLALGVAPLWVHKMPFPLFGNSADRGAKPKARVVVMIVLWMTSLLVSRLALAYYPTENDSRALWTAMKPYLPKGDYEIVTVDDRADGLLFYGAREVENVTGKKHPYPTFATPETVLLELAEMPADEQHHLFLVKGEKHLTKIKDVMNKRKMSIETVRLPYRRYLLICKPVED